MNPFISILIVLFASVPATVTTWLISFFAFDQTFGLSSLFALLGGGFTYYIFSAIARNRFLKQHGLSRKEYRYILKNLDEAKRKINRLNQSFFQIRELSSMRHRYDAARTARKIYKLAKKEPKRFYKAETFFFSHLDSVVEISEKYALLSTQPIKTLDIEQSLIETRHTLKELNRAIEQDLHQMLSDDIDYLNFEIDVAKHSLKKLEEPKNIDDNGKVEK